jgi:hypothetical protein
VKLKRGTSDILSRVYCGARTRKGSIGGDQAAGAAILRVFAILLVLCSSAFSEERSPGESEHKADTPYEKQQESSQLQRLLPPSTIPTHPVVNVFTAKHADEKSECASPKNWKEWSWFAVCRSWEWLDAEKTIAIFTVILGIATGFLWWATRNLVRDARESSRRQLRAYISANPLEIASAEQEERFVQITFGLKNHGQTPAHEMHYIFGFDVFANPLPEGFTYPQPTIPIHAESALFPQGDMVVWFNFNRLISTDEFSLVERDGLRLHIWGSVFYRTAFEEQGQCHTDFRASVGGPAFVANLRATRRKKKDGPSFRWTWEAGHGNGN